MRVALIGLALAAAAGCDESSTPTSSQALPDRLAGTWTLVALQAAGQAEQPTPAGAPYSVTFAADGRLSARADCNTCGGTFIVSGQTLTAGPVLACTRAACSTMAFEAIYTSLLGGDSIVTVSGGTLVLTSSRGVLRFSR